MKTMKIALTGGIGGGKSTAGACIRDMGYPVFSCDEIYKDVILAPDYVKRIKESFPEAVRNGEVDRKILARLIFNDPFNRQRLNEISHPLIMSKLLDEMDKSSSELTFAEVPLLFEGNFENLFDRIIVLERDQAQRIADVKDRDHVKEEEVQKRIKAQFDYFSEEGKRRMKACGAIILKNDGSFNKLSTELKKIIASFN